MTQALIYIGGVVSGVVVQWAVGAVGKGLAVRARKSRAGRAVLRLRAKRGAAVEALSERDGSTIGTVHFPWVVAAFGPFAREHINSTYLAVEPNYPPEVEAASDRLAAELRQKAMAGEEVPSDSDGFKLVRFHVSSRTRERDEAFLHLHFAPTTYYRAIATLRQCFGADADLRTEPISACATHWGVGLAVITKDRRFVFSRRASRMTEDGGSLYPAVAEGGLRAKDALEDGAPDHFSIAARGMREELGLELARSELIWLSFGANATRGAYGLLGRVESPFTFDELTRHHRFSRDNWEASELIAVDFEPEAISDFLQDAHTVPSFTLAVTTHALIHEYGLRRCDRAFRGCSIRASEWKSNIPAPALREIDT
jgi:hypothetical protein